MAVKLTCEQEDCVKTALEGHNFSIFGEAGTGKSRVVSEICRLKGKGVRVVCSTGIACEVFKDDVNLAFPAVTVHSFIGVGTAQGSFNSVFEKACSNQRIRKELLEAKCVVWDECSMGSARLLELFHAITSQVRDKKLPFGGIQTILVGDWLQLKPVADKFDDGEPMYKSVLFPSLFPHTIQLTIVHRQNEREVVYRHILRQLRVGRCDNDSEQAISALSRDLNNADGAIHLYFTNLHVDAHNVSRLDLLPGERESFTAIDTGDLRGLNCAAPQMSYFKSGAPVIVLYNINEIIHNGTRGTFVRKLDENTAVINVGGGEYVIQKISWTNVNEDGHSIGSRLQVPLKLHWASTIHKSQGLTLEKVVVHSAYEFTGGLLYTAFSRVRSIDDVQVLGFNKKHVCKRNHELNELNNLPNSNIVNCPCFKEIDHSLEEQPINPQDISDEELLQIVHEMFDDQESNTEEQSERLVSMEEVLEMVEENEHILSKPPEDFDMKMFLKSFKGQSVPGEEANFGRHKNAAVDSAVRNIDQFSALVQIVWHKIFVLLQKHLTENIQDIVFSQKDLKEFYQKSLDISRTLEYRGWLKECFQTPESTLLKPTEISIGFDIVLGVFHNTLDIVGESVRAKSRDDMVSTFSVKQMDDVGRGKVRFVAAWAVSRVLQKAKKYVRDNLYTASSATRSQVNKYLHKIELIESIVVIPYGILCSETKYPETLEVTESRQYRTHGLIHVSDQFFEFALELEHKRMNGLNSRMLKVHGDKLVEVVEAGLLNDQSLRLQWRDLFDNFDIMATICEEVFVEVVKRYVNMGANQFVKEFRRKWQVKKAMAHRQMVMARKDKRVQQEAKVPVSEIIADQSDHKERSHHRMKELVSKFGDAVLGNLYTRAELISLSRAYGLNPSARSNKAQLGKILADVIRSNLNIPFPWSLVPGSQLHAAPIPGRIGIRISRISSKD